VIDPMQSVTVNDVLSIMSHDDFEMNCLRLFISEDVLEDPVQTVRFRGRAVMRAHRKMNVRISGFKLPNFVQSGLIVWVRSDENVIVAVEDGGAVLLDHPRDDCRLIPKRNYDCDRLLRLGEEQSTGRADARSIAPRSQIRNEINENVV